MFRTSAASEAIQDALTWLLSQTSAGDPYAFQLRQAANLFLALQPNGSNAFAVLTASGQNAPILTTVGAMTLVGLRMYLYLVVPGMAIARLGSATLRWYADRVCKPNAASAASPVT